MAWGKRGQGGNSSAVQKWAKQERRRQVLYDKAHIRDPQRDKVELKEKNDDLVQQKETVEHQLSKERAINKGKTASPHEKSALLTKKNELISQLFSRSTRAEAQMGDEKARTQGRRDRAEAHKARAGSFRAGYNLMLDIKNPTSSSASLRKSENTPSLNIPAHSASSSSSFRLTRGSPNNKYNKSPPYYNEPSSSPASSSSHSRDSNGSRGFGSGSAYYGSGGC
jgi:hypothetical protein